MFHCLGGCVLTGITVCVVLQGLGVTTFKQGQYDESLQMRWRLHDILVTISPESEEMAQGRR